MALPGRERLPLFPLGLVLFPGLVLPLHVFEERYRVLVRELLERPEPERRFGVVAIREGREVGADGVRALHAVGCVARLQQVQSYPDGRYDVVTTGTERFRLEELHLAAPDRPYLAADVELLPESDGDADEARLLRAGVERAHRDYLGALESAGGDVEFGDVPDDPTVASYLVAATVLLDLDERQALLAAPDTVQRLRAELRTLRRESVLLRTLAAVPAPELTRSALSLN